MTTEIRLDAGTVASVKRTPQGGLRVDARLTRVGVLEYRRADGSVRRELRHPDEVFRADSLESLRGAPVTDLHPSEMVRTDTFASLARGHVGDDVRSDGNRFVAATLYVQDARLVEMVERGDRREISCGYTCDFDPAPGEWNGQRYDGVQRNIVYNHAALGPRDWGRAGSEVSIRMDAGDVWASDRIDEVDMENEEAPASVVEDAKTTCDSCGAPLGEDGKYHAPVTDSKTEEPAEKMDSLRGRCDAQEAEINALRARLDEANDPKRIAALVADALAVRAVAERAGVERLDGDAQSLRIAVVEKVTGIRCDGKGDEYVSGMYAAAVATLERDGVKRARIVLDSPRIDGANVGSVLQALRETAEVYVRVSNQKGGH